MAGRGRTDSPTTKLRVAFRSSQACHGRPKIPTTCVIKIKIKKKKSPSLRLRDRSAPLPLYGLGGHWMTHYSVLVASQPRRLRVVQPESDRKSVGTVGFLEFWR
jgi:hypothetical protein